MTLQREQIWRDGADLARHTLPRPRLPQRAAGGVDCGQLIVGVAKELGVLPFTWRCPLYSSGATTASARRPHERLSSKPVAARQWPGRTAAR